MSSDDDTASVTSVDAKELERKLLAEGKMRAELKHIDKKFTDEGTLYYDETAHEEIPEQVEWWNNFALCIVRHWDMYDKKRIEKTCLEINSSFLKDMLKELIPEFPGVSFDTNRVSLDEPYQVLFHYRREIEAAGKDLENGTDQSEHHRLLMNFINERFQETIAETDNLLEKGLITFEHLWTIFRPGSKVYSPVYGQPRVFEVYSYAESCRPKGLYVHTKFVDFDGDDFGYRDIARFIPYFVGNRPIQELPTFPMSWHKNRAEVEKALIDRGRRFETQTSHRFHCYNGVAFDTCFEDNKVVRHNISGRVVVDTKTFHRMNADYAFGTYNFAIDDDVELALDYVDDEIELTPGKKKYKPLTSEQCLLATSTVRGFSFQEKKWLDFFLDTLSSPNWNAEAFDQLVLPPQQKDLVRSLVATHVKDRGGFDDVIQGKGMGLIMVLHGPPGVGKTLTAETVAEFTERPLYMVSSGDLGTESSSLDIKLTRILDMAQTWKAILLIDEADIFLEARSLHDLERNSLVSIFLRVLEYYEGILFLTSNRVSTFDSAFKSRIHVPLKYGDLTFAARREIWRNFLRNRVQDVQVDVADSDFDKLAQADLNGRQIKNIIRTAKSLAQYHKENLSLSKLQQVIKIQVDFEDELDGLLEVDRKGLGGKMVIVNGQ